VGCSEDDAKQVRDLADNVLERMDENRKAKALEEARATLAAAGLTLKDLGKAKMKPNEGPLYKGGHTYQLPLIVDELGYVPLSKSGAELLFETFSQRYERASTLITSKLFSAPARLRRSVQRR